MKKSVIKLLFCLMGILWLSLIGSPAFAWVDDYPQKYKDSKMDAIVDDWKMYNRECTSFVAFRINSRNGIPFKNSYLQKPGYYWGHAVQWKAAADRAGIRVDNNPVPGDIAWSGKGEHGHVAWVEKVEGNKVYVEEYNYKKNATGGIYGNRIVTVGDGQFNAYIHLHRLDVCTKENGKLMPLSKALVIGELEDRELYGLRDGKWEAPIILSLKDLSRCVSCRGNRVTGLSLGKAVITAEDLETGAKTEFLVQVTEPSIELVAKKKTIYIGQEFNLEPKVVGAVKKIVWKSSKSGIVEINKAAGSVTGKKAGATTVTGRIKGMGYEAKCKITVKEPSISLNKKDLALWVGDSYQLKASVKGASSKVKWKSSKPKVVKVDKNGNVTALKTSLLGVKITAKANGKSASCIVRTLIKPSLKLNMTSLDLTAGKTRKLTYTAKGLEGEAIWKTSNKKVATVKNGVVTAKKAGTVTITLKIGSKTAKCVVNVTTGGSIYKAYLKKAKTYFDRRGSGSMNMAVYDIDKNGVPELILERRDQDMAPCYDVFTYKKESAKKVGTLIMWGLVGVDEKPFIVSYIPDEVTVYQLKNGKLKIIRQMGFPARAADGSSERKEWNSLCQTYIAGKESLQERYYSKAALASALKKGLNGSAAQNYNR